MAETHRDDHDLGCDWSEQKIHVLESLKDLKRGVNQLDKDMSSKFDCLSKQITDQLVESATLKTRVILLGTLFGSIVGGGSAIGVSHLFGG